MTQSLNDITEIVCGLVINGKIQANSVDTRYLMAPYDNIIETIKANKGNVKTEKLIEVVGLMPVQAAIQACDAINGLQADWLELLKGAYVRQEVGSFMEKTGRKLMQGKDVDVSKIVEMTNRIMTNTGSLIRMSEIQTTKKRFVLTGWDAIDYHLGGIPTGLVTVAAPPKTGKTSFMLKLCMSFAKKQVNKNVVIFTIEMDNNELVCRCQDLDPEFPVEAQARIHLCEDILDVKEIANKAATVENVGLICIDFADLMIDGEADPGKMETIYRTLAILAKQLKVPVVLLAQLSGSYQGGIPRPMHIRWTRLAEAMSHMLLMLYAPSRDYFAEKDKKLVPVPGMSYICAWLSRGGFKKHPGPGAIMLPWTGRGGWGLGKGRWFSLSDEEETSNE